jgi:hypothetical protein
MLTSHDLGDTLEPVLVSQNHVTDTHFVDWLDAFQCYDRLTFEQTPDPKHTYGFVRVSFGAGALHPDATRRKQRSERLVQCDL